MSAIATPSVRPSLPVEYTPDDLLQMQEQGLFELAEGRLIEKNMSFLANETAGNITFILKSHFKSTNSKAAVLPEQSFQCFAKKPRQVRRPGVAVIVADRVPAVRPLGHVKIAPDIAIEVLSPNDNVYELDFKLDDYRLAAIPLVWVVNPINRVIRVHRPGKPIDELRDGDLLTGDTILPGFAVSITDLLLPAEVTSEVPEAKEE
jgi:Uma2 family endonuclease